MTLTCPHCGKPTSASALKCAHCNREVKKVTVQRAARRIKCPRCQVQTNIQKLAGIELDLCAKCCGLWFDMDEIRQFEKASAQYDVNEEVKSVLNDLSGLTSRQTKERVYIKCPICKSQMKRINYAEISGIIVDRCPDHGTWLDHADATELLELMSEGGKETLLRKAKVIQNEELRSRVKRLEQRAAIAKSARGMRKSEWGDSILDLFDFF